MSAANAMSPATEQSAGRRRSGNTPKFLRWIRDAGPDGCMDSVIDATMDTIYGVEEEVPALDVDAVSGDIVCDRDAGSCRPLYPDSRAILIQALADADGEVPWWLTQDCELLVHWRAQTQMRPKDARLDRRETGIMPHFVARTLDMPSIIRPDPGHMPDVAAQLVRRVDPEGLPFMPGLDIDAGGASAFILAILDAGSASRPGAGAPLRDRCFGELLMASALDTRIDGERHRLPGLTIADAVDWVGWRRQDYRPDYEKMGLALARGLNAVNTIQLPLNDRGGWLIPAFVEAVRGRRLDDPVAATVRLYEDAARGARVDRNILRPAGRASAIAWRLYLALCFEWARISRQGRTPHLTRPAMERDPRGRLLDGAGNIMSGPDPTLPFRDRRRIADDRPATDWRDSRAIPTGSRESSPEGERLHRVYDRPGDLVSTVWPVELPAGVRANPQRTEAQAVHAARWLAAETDGGKPLRLNRQSLPEPGVRIVRLGRPTKSNPHAFPWRLVPPWIA